MMRLATPERGRNCLTRSLLSLRPLAAGVKTSPRMLLYFGSEEELISEILAQICLRQHADFARAVSGTGRRKQGFLRAWHAWSSPRMRKFWRYCFGVYGVALQNPKQFQEFLKRFIGDWLGPFEQALSAAGFPPERARSLATLRWPRRAGCNWICWSAGSEPGSTRRL
jgi:AcrR family transcriptional regulator